MSTYISSPVWCRIGGGTPILSAPGEYFVFGGGAFFSGAHPASKIPSEWEGDIVGGGTAVPMTAEELLSHQEYKLMCGLSAFRDPEFRREARRRTQEWVSVLEDAVGIKYGGTVPESIGELRQWMEQWEANGRPCQCGSGAPVALCPEASSYCG